MGQHYRGNGRTVHRPLLGDALLDGAEHQVVPGRAKTMQQLLACGVLRAWVHVARHAPTAIFERYHGLRTPFAVVADILSLPVCVQLFPGGGDVDAHRAWLLSTGVNDDPESEVEEGCGV